MKVGIIREFEENEVVKIKGIEGEPEKKILMIMGKDDRDTVLIDPVTGDTTRAKEEAKEVMNFLSRSLSSTVFVPLMELFRLRIIDHQGKRMRSMDEPIKP